MHTGANATLRRKHRLYVDVTFSQGVSSRDAAKGLQLIIDWRLDLAASPVWDYEGSPYVDKISIVEKRK